jgi:hypothetical protein
MINDKPNAQKIQLFGTVLRDIEVFQRGCPEYNKKIVARLPQLLDHLARFPVCCTASLPNHLAQAHDLQRMTEEEMNNASLALRPSKVVTADSSSSDLSTYVFCPARVRFAQCFFVGFIGGSTRTAPGLCLWATATLAPSPRRCVSIWWAATRVSPPCLSSCQPRRRPLQPKSELPESESYRDLRLFDNLGFCARFVSLYQPSTLFTVRRIYIMWFGNYA